MVQMFLELFRGEKEEILVLDVLAWSHGFSRRSSWNEETKKKEYQGNPELNQHPKNWNEQKVSIWLTENGLEQLIKAFQGKIRGKDLFYLSQEVLKEMNIDIFNRIHFETAVAELQQKWAGSDEENKYEMNDMSLQDLSITTYFDDRTLMSTFLMLNNTVLPKATLTNFHGGRRRRQGQVIDAGDDDLVKAKENDPLFRMECYDVKVTSISTGGSGGEDRFTANICLSFKTFSCSGQQYPADSKKSYRNFFPKPFGLEIQYNGEGNKTILREWGKIVEWNHNTHFSFPKEFQTIVKTMLMVHQRADVGNLVQFLPNTTLNLIFYKLSQYYIPTSPFEGLQFPGPVVDGANDDDSY